jgi:hypothetical protein
MMPTIVRSGNIKNNNGGALKSLMSLTAALTVMRSGGPNSNEDAFVAGDFAVTSR